MPGSAYVLFDGILTRPRLDHPECVAVHSDGTLWCGGEAGQIYRIDGGRIDQIAATDGFILGVSLAEDEAGGGALYACDLAHGCVWRLRLSDGATARFDRPIDGHPLINPNFPLVLPDGSLLVSDSGHAHQPRTGLLRYTPDGVGQVWLDTPIDFANGLALSPDRRTVYVAESWSYRVLAVDIDDTCAPAGEPRIYAETPGYVVDGLAVDGDGVLYVGCYEPSAVLRIAGPGQVDVLAHDPTAHVLCHPTGPALRGRQLILANLGRWHLSAVDLD
jgi:gluconolactonase